MDGMLGFGPKKVGNIMGISRNLENKLGQSVSFSFLCKNAYYKKDY